MRTDRLRTWLAILFVGVFATGLWSAPQPDRARREPRVPAEALRNPYNRKQMQEYMKKLIDAFEEDKMPETLDEYRKAPSATRRTKAKTMNRLLSLRNCMNNPDIQEILAVDKDWHRAVYKEAAKFVEASELLDEAIEKRDAAMYEKSLAMYDAAGKAAKAALKKRGEPMAKSEMDKLRKENIERRRKLYLNSLKNKAANPARPLSGKEKAAERRAAREK